MNAEDVTESQVAAFKAFFETPSGAWMLEKLIVENHVLDPIPSRVRGEANQPMTELEVGKCLGRRELVLELLDIWQQGVQSMYEAINRVDRMTRAEAEGGHFAKQ